MNWVSWKALSKKESNALSLLELTVTMAMIAVIFTAGFQIFSLSSRTVEKARQFTVAEQLSRDLIELGISKRNEDWNSLVTGEYYFTEDPDPDIGLVFTPGQETIEIFTRSIAVEPVNRNGSGEIVTSGGTVDPNTFRLVAETSWTSFGNPENVTLTQYVTNWKNF